MKTINRQNAMTANNFEMHNSFNADGTPTRCRRNGKTKTWKRSPERFQIPVKHGLYEYGYITEDNANAFYIAE